MKRQIFAGVLVLVLLSLLVPLQAFAYTPVEDEKLYVVNNPKATDRLHLRTKPNQSAPSLGKYYNGVRLEGLSEPKDGWIYVRVEASSVTGYMQTKYLVHNPSTPVAGATPVGTINNKDGTGLNLRAERSTSSSNLGFFANGYAVEVLAWGETWHHVQIENQTGYMLASKLSVAAGTSGSSSTETSSGDVIAKGVVNNPDPTDRLHLRKSVDASGRVGNSLGKYYSGVEVDILEYVKRGSSDWAYVRIGTAKRTGYMQMKYLAVDSNASKVTAAMPVVQVKNATSTAHLNLRAEPTVNAKSIGQYANGTKVVVMGVMNTAWSHVQVDGIEGFMMNRYLSPSPSFAK